MIINCDRDDDKISLTVTCGAVYFYTVRSDPLGESPAGNNPNSLVFLFVCLCSKWPSVLVFGNDWTSFVFLFIHVYLYVYVHLYNVQLFCTCINENEKYCADANEN